jgi:hypothetical protein
LSMRPRMPGPVTLETFVAILAASDLTYVEARQHPDSLDRTSHTRDPPRIPQPASSDLTGRRLSAPL